MESIGHGHGLNANIALAKLPRALLASRPHPCAIFHLQFPSPQVYDILECSRQNLTKVCVYAHNLFLSPLKPI